MCYVFGYVNNKAHEKCYGIYIHSPLRIKVCFAIIINKSYATFC